MKFTILRRALGRVRVANVVIYGAGGHARELLFQIEEEDSNCRVIALVDDFHHDRMVRDRRVMTYSQARIVSPTSKWILAIGDTDGRKTALRRVRQDGIEVGSFISRRAAIARSAEIGSAVQIFAGAIISDGTKLEENVIVNFSCVVSHDVSIGAHTTVSPRAAIAGHVTIGESVLIGVGATISNGLPNRPLCIGHGAIVGAGACVTKSVQAGTVVVGVPARPLRRARN
jgi:sugar O-acyltransferase (sialic acid O-acetyltransferase NeuD family)